LLVFSVFFFLFFGCEKNTVTTETGTPVAEPVCDIFLAPEHMGVNYGPFHFTGQNTGTEIPLSQVQGDLDLIVKNFKFIRTYTVGNGMDDVVPEAAARGMQVALGIHCVPNDAVKTKNDIDLAITVTKVNPNTVTALVIGNETNLTGTNYVDDMTVSGYMGYAKQKMTEAGLSGISVTSCITGTGGVNGGMGDSHGCPNILQRCYDLNDPGNRVIFMTIYPYYGQKGSQIKPLDIAGNMQWSHDNGMAQAERKGLDVIIGEIGWPSQGSDPNMENVPNEKLNFQATLNWINGANIYKKSYNTLWFSMFDEPWKVNEPFGIGPYWGLYEANGAQQPKFPIPPLH
jgi:exo-beta-1,3-glucanase (GH17 family)